MLEVLLKSKPPNLQPFPPRARVILEFPAGDTSRMPIIYTTAGSAEQDEALRREILKRWNRG